MYITLAMALAYLRFAEGYDLFFYLLRLLVTRLNVLELGKQKTSSLIDHLVFLSLCALVIVEHIQH